MTLDPSVDFGEIAKMTHDFSGADLQALIYNAHLRVVHAAIDASPTIRRSGHAGSEKRVDYVMLGGSGEKKILSRADESQLQKRVGEPLHSGSKSLSHRGLQLQRILENKKAAPASTNKGKASSAEPQKVHCCSLLF